MVGTKTGADQGDFFRPRIVYGKMTRRSFGWEHFRRWVIRSFLAESGILHRTNSRRKPDASLLIDHRIMHGRLAVPDRLVAPVRRRHHSVRLGAGSIRIADRHFYLSCSAMHLIENRKKIRAFFGSPVNRAVGINRGIALIRGDLVV